MSEREWNIHTPYISMGIEIFKVKKKFDMCTKLKIQPIDKNLIILLVYYVPFLLVYMIFIITMQTLTFDLFLRPAHK